MYKYKSWNDENKKFGSASNEIGSSWDEANKIAKSEIEKQEEERKKKEQQRQLEESQKPVETPKPSVWDKSAYFVSKTAGKVKSWYDDYSFRMNEKSIFNPGRDEKMSVDENGKLKVEYPRLEKYKQAQSQEEKDQIKSEALKSTAEKTPLLRFLNSEAGQKITGTVANNTANIPLKLVASLKAIGDDTFDESYAALMEERNDPSNPRWQRILYGIQDSGVQSAIGTLLAVGTSVLSRNPQAGRAVAMTYFSAISAESQRKEKGQVNSLGNIAIDTVGDTILSGVAEATLKTIIKEGGEASFKEFAKQTGKGFLVEGVTEPSQTFLKYANDYKNAKTEQEKQAVVTDLTEYVKNGGMVDEFLIGGISGGLVTATATGAGMVAGGGKGDVNPSLQPEKSTIGGSGEQEKEKIEPKKGVVAELDTDFTEIRDKVIELEKEVETSADENVLNDLVAYQDQLADYQSAVKERPVYISNGAQEAPLVEIETVQYPDGKFAFRFSADVETASVSGNFSNTELFKNKNEAVKAGGNAIIEWAKNELIGADEETTVKLNELTAKVQDIIEGKNIKPTKEEFLPKESIDQSAPGLANFDTSEEINAKYVTKAQESQDFESFKKGLDFSTIMSRIAPDVESDNLGAVDSALKSFYDKYGKKSYSISPENSGAIIEAYQKDKNLDRQVLAEKLGVPVEQIDDTISKYNKAKGKKGDEKSEEKEKKAKPSEKKTVDNKKQIEEIKSAEKELQKIYSENGEKVAEAMYEVFTELDIAEAGSKVFIDTSANKGPGNTEVFGIKSSFPQWIPEEYRSRKLFDKVMGGLMNVEEITFPNKNKTKQREFYNLLLDEVDDRAGIDTAEIRESIINNYEKIYAKETTTQNEEEAQTKKSVSGSAQGSEDGEINVDNVFSDIVSEKSTFYDQMKNGADKNLPAIRKAKDLLKSPLKLNYEKDGYFTFPNRKIESPADIAFAFKELKNEAVEKFYVIGTKKNIPVSIECISVGTMDASLVQPFETVDILLKNKVDGAYFVHNHPSGEVEPSEADVEVTKRLQEGYKNLGIEFKGHVIIDTTKFGLISDKMGQHTVEQMTEAKNPTEYSAYKKYVKWLTNKPEDFKITKPRDAAEISKGLNIDKKDNTLVIFTNARNSTQTAQFLSKEKLTVKNIAKIGSSARARGVFIVNHGLEVFEVKKLAKDLRVLGMELTDAVLVTDSGFSSASETGDLYQFNDKNLFGEETEKEKKAGEQKSLSFTPAKDALTAQRGVAQTSKEFQEQEARKILEEKSGQKRLDDFFASIDDTRQLATMLSTKESKALMEKLYQETNPNLRAFLTLELYKEITTQDLKSKGFYQGGWFDSKTNTVGIARDMSAEAFRQTFKHEVGHAAFASLPMKEKQAIVDWYKTLDQKTLIELYGSEETLNDYLKKSEKQKNADEFMADETVQRQMDQKNTIDKNSKMLKPLRDLITKIVLALNKINRKVFPGMAKRLKVQRLFKDVFSQKGGEKFAKSQAYLDELKLKGFREGTIKDMETGFSTQKISFAASVNAEEKTDEKVAKEFSENYGYKPTFYARGEFADYEEKFGEGVGGMEHIKPLELPELVKMVRELTGKFPEVKKSFRTNRLGDAQAGTLRVRILASLFEEDKIREAKAVLAHELGHIVDYLPENARRSGNILGRIATLSKYLKHTLPESLTFGAKFLKAKEMKAELIALSEYWHPYDKEKASPNFIKYRESNSEIYADALSVLFNSPGLLQEKAPNFYDAFFKFLDKKPAVKEMFFELQSLLDGNREEVIKARQGDLREGFAKAEEIIKQKHEERKAGNKNFWARMRQQLDDQNYAIIQKQRAYEANGEIMPDDKNPKFLLDELPFVDNENYLLLDDMNKDVVQPIELAGMTMDDMGEYLVLNRIMNDRKDVANPYGFTPDSAKEQLEFLKKSVGEENFKMLEEKMKVFHEKVFASVEEAVKVGSYNKELFETTIEPNKGTYAAFRVVDYIEENMPAGIKKQVGTFKEIGNPFTATIIKTLSLNRLNAYQRAKTATIEMLEKEGEAVKSKSITTDGKLRIFKPGKGKGTIELLEDGKFQSYDVDPYIAERFEKDSIGEVNRLIAALDMFNNQLFKPLVTTYNMGFALAFNPIRDFKRNYKAIKNATVYGLLKSYAKSLPQSFRYARKAEMDEFTRSLVENKAIMAPVNDYNFDAREDEFGSMLERYGLVKVDEKTSKLPKIVRKVIVGNVIRILEAMRLGANTFEIVSKIAGAKVRIQGGETGKALYQNVRDYTGTPNWTRKGQHTRTTNAIFVFSNIMKEGLKSDFNIATNPNTRAGYWWKTVKVDLLPKVLMFAASAGIIDALFGLSGGDDDEYQDGPIKKFFAKVSEYDKSNYIIIPLGTTEAGKAVYMRIPHDETGRLISTALWKMMSFAKNRELEQMSDIFAIGAGQLPSVTPIIDITSGWSQFLSGRNPYDSFRGRTVIDDQTFKAGGWRSLKKMLQWTTNTMGVSSFATYDTSKDTTIETTLRVTPLFNRLIRVSDYGLQEQEYKSQRKTDKEKARETLTKKEIIKEKIKEGAEIEDIVNAVSKELELNPEKLADYKKINLIRSEVKKEEIRQRTGTKTDMLLKAKSNDSKVEMLKKFRMEMQEQEFWDYVDDLYDNKVISANVYEQIPQ